MDNATLKIYYFAGSHWDREWYQPFQGFRFRLVAMMNEMIDALEKDPELKVFHFDGQTIILEDFSAVEPGQTERLARLIRNQRVIVGPWYVMPDEFLVSGESLIRNLLMGHRIAGRWGAEPWKYGYICDIFGHIAQMPQIFNGFGIKYALVGRGTNEHTTPAHFIWQSPDGSQCITFKLEDQNGYGSFCIEVLGWQDKRSQDIRELYPKIKEYIEYEKTRSDIPVILVMDGLDHEPLHPEIPQYLAMIRELYPQAEVRLANLEEMGRDLEQYRQQMTVRQGELNETAKKKAGYIHLITHTLSSRYPLKQANDECQALLEKWVEPLTALMALSGLVIQKTYVELAYKYLIQNHAHDSICGCAVDQVHRDMEYRFDQSRLISNQVLEEILNAQRPQASGAELSQTSVLQIWNPLPFARKEVVTVDLDFNPDYPTRYQEPFGYETKNSFKIFDREGHEIPYGLVSMKKNYRRRRYNQFVELVDVHTISLEVDLPALGSAEYKIVPFAGASRYLDCLSQNEREAENAYVKLKINSDGTLHLFDKITNQSYDRLLSYLDDGEIGDGWYHANPAEDRLLTSIGSECTIERVENGPSRTVFKVTNDMKVPASMEEDSHGIRRSRENVVLKISSRVGISKDTPYIDVETTIANTARDHRLRLKLPTHIGTRTYFVNQPFAFVERSTGVKPETQDWKECDVPEKQMGGIVAKRSADGMGLAFISAYGLHECAALDDGEGTMVVTLFRSFGKTVMTNGEAGGQILQDLTFKYRLAVIHAETSYADLTRCQDCLQAGIKATSYRVPDNYSLPEPRSYCELISDHVVLSIIKRPAGGGAARLIIRLSNLADIPAEAKLVCFKKLAGVTEVNLNEEYIRELPFAGQTVSTTLDPWKIQTLCLVFSGQ